MARVVTDCAGDGAAVEISRILEDGPFAGGYVARCAASQIR
jgi:hypothetical protein